MNINFIGYSNEVGHFVIITVNRNQDYKSSYIAYVRRVFFQDISSDSSATQRSCSSQLLYSTMKLHHSQVSNILIGIHILKTTIQ